MAGCPEGQHQRIHLCPLHQSGPAPSTAVPGATPLVRPHAGGAGWIPAGKAAHRQGHHCPGRRYQGRRPFPKDRGGHSLRPSTDFALCAAPSISLRRTEPHVLSKKPAVSYQNHDPGGAGKAGNGVIPMPGPPAPGHSNSPVRGTTNWGGVRPAMGRYLLGKRHHPHS